MKPPSHSSHKPDSLFILSLKPKPSSFEHGREMISELFIDIRYLCRFFFFFKKRYP